MKRFSSKLSAMFLSACMLLPTLSIGFPINYESSALAAETEANSMTYVPLEDAVDIEPQQLETFERNGFTVVEWGGSKIR